MNIRPYIPQDLPGVQALYMERKLAFDREMFQWKKLAPDSYSWIGETEGKIVAHYSIIEMPLLPSARTGFAVDGIFAKSHGQIAPISQMLNHALHEVRQAGLDVIVSFANEKMGTVKKFLGWKTIGRYCWKKSSGKKPVTERSGAYPFRVIHQEDVRYSEVYQHWRWDLCPRVYNCIQMKGQIIALFSTEDFQMILWEEPSACAQIEEGYSFWYLTVEVGDVLQGYADKNANPDSLEPLYYPLSEEREWKWPVRWPLETVEGVTLGW
ncbi:hypothetical protein [Paenibacillus sp. MSJ-34]|uniref:hypothetical protein n=1 Tax=Paenibacillus sp. MSJ-34 TaxID=2841529 RepID=UPI001C12981D|nr:hypothetical protein [Paenibacillus sp. MSJ-34]MBU5441007.1 hypothetical protein [Paenibacillus sp. MSJ-34]